MAPESKKPDIERITNRYIDAWEMFEEERFTADDLETELLRVRDPEDVPDADSINSDLYRVSVLGLVDWFGEGEYQVAIPPEANEGEWSSLIENQTTWIRSEIQDRLEERQEAEETEDESEPSDEPEIIEHDGHNYMSAFVGRSSDLEGQARFYQAALKPSSHDGVVLRAYQDVASAADELAEAISDDNQMSETVCVYRFEIDDTEMAETDDDLEYRVYLKETKLL